MSRRLSAMARVTPPDGGKPSFSARCDGGSPSAWRWRPARGRRRVRLPGLQNRCRRGPPKLVDHGRRSSFGQGKATRRRSLPGGPDSPWARTCWDRRPIELPFDRAPLQRDWVERSARRPVARAVPCPPNAAVASFSINIRKRFSSAGVAPRVATSSLSSDFLTAAATSKPLEYLTGERETAPQTGAGRDGCPAR